MNNSSANRSSANEQSVDELHLDTIHWKNQLQMIAEEIIFFNKILVADIYKLNLPNLFEKLQIFITRIESLRIEKMDLNRDIHNHKYDLDGMLECEDIGCDIFYHSEHQKLKERIYEFLKRYQHLKSELMLFTGDALRPNNKN